MKKIFIIGVFLCLLIIGKVYSQMKPLKYPILIDVNNQYIRLYSKKDSSVYTNMGNDSSKLIKVFKLNQLGRLHFIILNNLGHIRKKGQYIESLALLSEYDFVRRFTGNLEIIVRKFYKPLRDGEWLYYDELGEIYLKEKYIRGILIETIPIRKIE
jgi:hypothetical protein